MSERLDDNLTPGAPLRPGEGETDERRRSCRGSIRPGEGENRKRLTAEVGRARALLLAVAFAVLTVAGGCIFVDAQFSMAPDGATSARMEAGVLKSLAEQAEGDFTTDLNEALVEGNWTELDAFERDQWQVHAWEGHAGPGEHLFVEGDMPAPQFSFEEHALSTIYTFELLLPEEPMMAEPPAAQLQPAPEGEGGEADEGVEQFGEALGGMMTMMMSSGDAGLRFSVELPGDLVATNGEFVSPTRVGWKIDLTAERPPVDALVARSRLPKWQLVGELGMQMAQMGRWDLVPAMISGVRRGVLPDPVGAQAADELNTRMYVQATEIMLALDDAAGEQIATRVLHALGVSGDADPVMVEEIAMRLEGMDLGVELKEEVLQQLLGLLGGG